MSSDGSLSGRGGGRSEALVVQCCFLGSFRGTTIILTDFSGWLFCGRTGSLGGSSGSVLSGLESSELVLQGVD